MISQYEKDWEVWVGLVLPHCERCFSRPSIISSNSGRNGVRSVNMSEPYRNGHFYRETMGDGGGFTMPKNSKDTACCSFGWSSQIRLTHLCRSCRCWCWCFNQGDHQAARQFHLSLTVKRREFHSPSPLIKHRGMDRWISACCLLGWPSHNETQAPEFFQPGSRFQLGDSFKSTAKPMRNPPPISPCFVCSRAHLVNSFYVFEPLFC